MSVLTEAQLARAAAENAQRQVAMMQDMINNQVSSGCWRRLQSLGHDENSCTLHQQCLPVLAGPEVATAKTASPCTGSHCASCGLLGDSVCPPPLQGLDRSQHPQKGNPPGAASGGLQQMKPSTSLPTPQTAQGAPQWAPPHGTETVPQMLGHKVEAPQQASCPPHAFPAVLPWSLGHLYVTFHCMLRPVVARQSRHSRGL